MRDDVPKTAVNRARSLRRSMTEPEQQLWRLLRDRRLQGVKFRRQAPVGPFIVDFLSVEHRLVIEADGSQHADSARDRGRDAWLAANGYRVGRFWNHEIMTERQSVLDTIAALCGLSW
jgi:2-isopropylmalate synthase